MPRIGPVSDFYGVVVPPSPIPCNGIITFPARTLHFGHSDNFDSASLEQALVQMQISGGNISQTDTYVVSDGFQIPAGLAGYYRLTLRYKPQIATVGGVTLSLYTELRINGVVFYSDVMAIGTPSFGNTFPQYTVQIPILPYMAVGDRLTMFARGDETASSPIWSGVRYAGATASEVYADFYFLGT